LPASQATKSFHKIPGFLRVNRHKETKTGRSTGFTENLDTFLLKPYSHYALSLGSLCYPDCLKLFQLKQQAMQA